MTCTSELRGPRHSIPGSLPPQSSRVSLNTLSKASITGALRTQSWARLLSLEWELAAGPNCGNHKITRTRVPGTHFRAVVSHLATLSY